MQPFLKLTIVWRVFSYLSRKICNAPCLTYNSEHWGPAAHGVREGAAVIEHTQEHTHHKRYSLHPSRWAAEVE